MCQSAGLRKCSPIIRFHDEYGSLGSFPTPLAMQRKVYRHLFTPVSEPKKNLTYHLYELAPYRCWNVIDRTVGIPCTAEEYEERIYTIRN